MLDLAGHGEGAGAGDQDLAPRSSLERRHARRVRQEFPSPSGGGQGGGAGMVEPRLISSSPSGGGQGGGAVVVERSIPMSGRVDLVLHLHRRRSPSTPVSSSNWL